MDWPIFDAPLLIQIAGAFARRRKAIAYRAGLACEREFTEAADGVYERLNLESGNLRLCIWSDGVMWLGVSVRRSGQGAGWAFQDAFHGHVMDVSGESLVAMLEATLSLPFGTNPDQERRQLRETWMRVRPYAGR